jgi:hypothetical protein
MIEKKKGEITFFQLPGLTQYEDRVWHGFFTSLGGCSTGEYFSLNVNFEGDDKIENVKKNREQILDLTGSHRFSEAVQVHGTGIRVLENGKEPDPFLQNEQEADAIVTDIKGLPLLIRTADCQSVLLFDPENNVIANIHSGWRGSVQDICGKTVDVMCEKFNTEPSTLLGGIGPSLGPCCAEFINWKKELPESFLPFKDSGNRFDFWGITTMQLVNKGMKKENIEKINMCTCCSDDTYFSYRRNKARGRLANVIMLK